MKLNLDFFLFYMKIFLSYKYKNIKSFLENNKKYDKRAVEIGEKFSFRHFKQELE